MLKQVQHDVIDFPKDITVVKSYKTIKRKGDKLMNKKIKKLKAFTLAEGGHSPLLCGDEGTQGSPRLVKNKTKKEKKK